MDNAPVIEEHPFAHVYTEGTAVFDGHGEKVGVVGAPPTQGNFLVVQKGWLFTYELYIPLTEIHTYDANGIFLNLTKEQLQDDRWKIPPGGGSAVEVVPPSSIPPTELPGQALDPLDNGILPGPIPVDPLSNG